MSLVEQNLDSLTMVESQPADSMGALARAPGRRVDGSKSSAQEHIKWHGPVESKLLLPSHRCESFAEHAGSGAGVLPG